MNTDTSSYGSVIMDLIKEKFKVYSLWRRIESDIAILCSRIPEATSTERKDKVVKILKEIKSFLIENDVAVKELDFLDEEIERYEKTIQISKYEELTDSLDKEIIDKYSRFDLEGEGIIGIHLGLNYEQLKKLTNGVYRETGMIKFYISPEITLGGKILAEMYDYAQDIPVATLMQTKKVNPDTGFPQSTKIMLFGEKYSKAEWVKVKEVNVKFYVYRFVSERNDEYIILSTEKQTIGDYIIKGVQTQIDDYKMLTETSKLPTKLPYIFIQEVKNRIVQYGSHEELRKRLALLQVNKTNFFNFPFTLMHKGKRMIMKHPEWFKWLLWSWMLHSKKGMGQEYPMHLMIIGDHGSGKSTVIEAIHKKTKESNQLFSGVSSTLKDLVPSFKYKPARLGYLSESNRFAFMDEFLRCIVRSNKAGQGLDEELAIMNDLLEHRKRRAGSGVSHVNVNMTARIIATTNPIREVHAVEDLVRKFDNSFLSRWLIYYQSKKQVEMVRNCAETDIETLDYDMSNDDFVSIIDYVHTFDATFDQEKVNEIYKDALDMLPSDLKDHYTSRHKHHIQCVIDGIIKTRCVFEKDMSFKAKAEDYEILGNVWAEIIKSWINSDNLKNVPLKRRIHYMPDIAQYAYEVISKHGKPMVRRESEEIICKELTRTEYITAMMILLNNELINDDDGFVKPYWMEEKK